jgi:hypothetical protein
LYGGESAHQFHHVNFYLGPINEILNGKMLMANAYAQYGILTTYIPAIIFSHTKLSYSGFVLYDMIISAIYCIFFFYFMKKVTGSILGALITTLSFIRLVFFRSIWTNEVYVYPSSTPLRYIFDILVLILVYKQTRRNSVIRAYIASFIVALSLFYNLEIGLPIYISYFIFIIFLYFHNGITEIAVKRILRNILFLTFNTVLFIGIISYITFTRTGIWPDWLMQIGTLLFYGKGFFDIPMPITGEYFFIVGIYIYTFYFINHNLKTHEENNLSLLTFILCYGIGIFVYYLGFNEPHHLYTISHPSVILFFYHLQRIFRKRRSFSEYPVVPTSLIITFFAAFTFWLISPTPGTYRNITSVFYNRYINKYQNYYYWNYPGADFYLSKDNGKLFADSAELIKYNITSDNILILSRYDTLLYAMSGKGSFLDNPIIEYGIMHKYELNYAINAIFRKKPEYIFLYASSYNQMKTDNIPIIWNAIKDDYEYVYSTGVLDVYKLIQLSPGG